MKKARQALLVIGIALVFLEVIGLHQRALAKQQQKQAASQWMLDQAKLPADVHLDTLSRALRTKASDFSDPNEQKIVVRMAATEEGRWLGPAGTRLQIPEYAEDFELSSHTLDRFIDPKLEELIVAVAARELGNQTLFLDHLEDGNKAHGSAVQEIVRLRKDTKGLDAKQAAIIEFGRELFKLPRTAPVSAKVYAEMQKNFGGQGTLAITARMIAYDSDTLLQRAYDQHMDTSADCKGHRGCLDLKNSPALWENPTSWQGREESESEWAAEQATLPADVLPETLCRVPRAKESDFTSEEDKQAFAKVNNAPGSKQLVSRWLGPTGMRLQIPQYADVMNTMNKAIRTKSGLDPKDIEVTAGLVTRENGSREQFIDHIDDGIKAYGEEVQEAIRLRKDTEGLDPKQAAIIEFGRELFKMPMTASVSAKAFASLDQNFGRKGALGIIAEMAYYDGNLMLIRTYDQYMDTRPNCSGSHMGCMDLKNLPPAW